MLKKFASYLFIVIILVSILNAGNFLMVDENPVKDDVIIGLGGMNIPTTDYSVKLYNEGYSNMLLFSGGVDDGDGGAESIVMEKEALHLNIPVKNIIGENKSVSTYENALFTKKILVDYNFKSAIIVTSTYHMRRSRLVFNKAFQNTGIKLTFCSFQDKYFKSEWWFMDTYSRHIVISEYEKLIGYFIEGRLF